MKVMSILGTRPDLIKMSEIIKKLDQHTEHVFVHTGQNHDYELNGVFYGDLGLRKPDHFLNAAGDSLGQTLGKLMRKIEQVLEAEKPDAVVILGDTNSALSSIIVKRRKIPLFHLEAGNRCFDDNVPEEVNRRIIDHISDVNLTFSENARRYLLAEGLPKDRTFLMGSPMHEVLSKHLTEIEQSTILDQLELDKYYLFSVHRDENVEMNFAGVIDAVNALAEVTDSTVVMPLHPRTRQKLEGVSIHRNILTTVPFGFLDYCKLQTSAACVISDSGTLAEESALLNFPAVTIRNAIERPEAMDAGTLIMCRPDAASLMEAISVASAPNAIPKDYLVENCSDRVLKIILSYTSYVQRYVWHV